MMGFKFKLVLADSLYGESDSNFVSVLCELQLDFVVAIRVIMVYGYHKVRKSDITNGDRITVYFLMASKKNGI